MNRIIKIFNYQFYVKEFLVIFFTFLLMENIFSWLVLPVSVIVLLYEKIMSLIIFAFLLYNFNNQFFIDIPQVFQPEIGVLFLIL